MHIQPFLELQVGRIIPVNHCALLINMQHYNALIGQLRQLVVKLLYRKYRRSATVICHHYLVNLLKVLRRYYHRALSFVQQLHHKF